MVILGAHGPLTKAEFSVDRWSEGVKHLVVRQEVGAYFASNDATLKALAGAQCVSVGKKKDGISLSFSLPSVSARHAVHKNLPWRKE
jgi:hypothetical protein